MCLKIVFAAMYRIDYREMRVYVGRHIKSTIKIQVRDICSLNYINGKKRMKSGHILDVTMVGLHWQ